MDKEKIMDFIRNTYIKDTYFLDSTHSIKKGETYYQPLISYIQTKEDLNPENIKIVKDFLMSGKNINEVINLVNFLKKEEKFYKKENNQIVDNLIANLEDLNYVAFYKHIDNLKDEKLKNLIIKIFDKVEEIKYYSKEENEISKYLAEDSKNELESLREYLTDMLDNKTNEVLKQFNEMISPEIKNKGNKIKR